MSNNFFFQPQMEDYPDKATQAIEALPEGNEPVFVIAITREEYITVCASLMTLYTITDERQLKELSKNIRNQIIAQNSEETQGPTGQGT